MQKTVGGRVEGESGVTTVYVSRRGEFNVLSVRIG